MKKSLIALLVVAPLTLTLSGCIIVDANDGYNISTDFEDREYDNRKKIAKLQLGSSFNDIQQNLGVADFSETYAKGETEVRVLFYRTQRKQKDGLTTKNECTYLHFENGALVETGNGGEYSRIKNG